MHLDDERALPCPRRTLHAHNRPRDPSKGCLLACVELHTASLGSCRNPRTLDRFPRSSRGLSAKQSIGHGWLQAVETAEGPAPVHGRKRTPDRAALVSLSLCQGGRGPDHRARLTASFAFAARLLAGWVGAPLNMKDTSGEPHREGGALGQDEEDHSRFSRGSFVSPFDGSLRQKNRQVGSMRR